MGVSLRRGFSLAEVLVAFGTLSIALLAVVGVFIWGLNLMQHAEEHSVAAELGKEFLETVEVAGGFSAMPAGPRFFDGEVPDPVSASFPPPPYPSTTVGGVDYYYKVWVEEHPTLAEVRAVKVEIRWSETGRSSFETAFIQ